MNSKLFISNINPLINYISHYQKFYFNRINELNNNYKLIVDINNT